ncbi:MAG: Ig-like domain-containing protein [Clostridia bacterium]|nr:Ig-like domain-containing protein [Clostridia bacterium]
MIFTMIPSMLFNVSAEESYPVIERYTAASSTEFHAYYAKIYSVTFLDEIDWNDINSAEQYWDSSAADDGSVISYIKYNESQSTAAGADRYDLYIAGDGGVGANPTSSYVFYSFSALKEVNGLENFKTENATTFYQMFGVCRALEYVDFSNCDTSNVVNLSYMFNQCENLETVIFAGWDTSNVTDMSSMFYNCKNMKTLDLSSFDTSKVTTMRYMFYHCEKLEYVYVGDGWTTESVANLNDGMFNCCYAIVGGKDVYDSNFIYGAPGAEYAKTKEDGGFLDYKEPAAPVKYTVSYVFDGATVPTGVTVPVSAEYDAGTTVKVADSLYADGFVFSGWKTTDTVVTDGEFVVENNVVFTGSWSELYNVTYAYADGYDVPAGASAVPVTAAYKAGDAVTVADLPFVDGYVFVGWDTDDISVTDGKFAMPGNDVTFYGYFKKPVESVEINGGDIVLDKNGESQINVTVRPDDATVKDIEYKSSDENVVKVDEDGKVTAVGVGTATITVNSKDDPSKSDTISVTVKVPVTSITVDKTEITLNKDDSAKITATVTPADATNKTLIYESADESVVTVDANGNIIAVGEGETIITVTSKDNPTVKATVSVKVKIPVTEIIVTENISLNIGDETNLNAKVNADATEKGLDYETSDPGVVKVFADGSILATGKGEAVITVTSKDDPTKKETVKVTVTVPVEDVVVDKTDITLDVGKKDKLTVTVTPDDASDKGVTYTSSNNSVVTVDANGNITAVGKGEAVITVTSKDDPTKKETVKVTVTVPVEDVVVDKTDITLDIGKKDKLTVTVTPDDASDKGVTYTSSNNSVVTVDENGNITAVGKGEAVITVTSKDNPTKKETVKVTVTVPVDKITVNKSEILLTVGKTDKIAVKVTPDDASDKNVIFTSGDNSIATVDKYGNVTAVGEGETYITIASVSDPSKTKTVKVRVYIPENPGYLIDVPENAEVEVGETVNLGIKVTPAENAPKAVYDSSDESIVMVDADGNITGVAPGKTTIIAEFETGEIFIIHVTVAEPVVVVPVVHHVCFGKTDGIGWYEVSVNGGEFFPQGPNSTLEVEHGSVLVIRVQDMWIGDEFDFYVNGDRRPVDENNTITVVVEGYTLIGALSMEVVVPDPEESLTLFERLINAIKAFFEKIAEFFSF